jgi:acetamidase/formamidase
MAPRSAAPPRILRAHCMSLCCPVLSRQEAYMIASIAVDYHVTQVVDGTKGIHGMIPKAIFAS